MLVARRKFDTVENARLEFEHICDNANVIRTNDISAHGHAVIVYIVGDTIELMSGQLCFVDSLLGIAYVHNPTAWFEFIST